MNWYPDLIYFTASLVLVALGMAPLRAWLQSRSILDHPNERSSHTRPTPKGGGLVMVPVVVAVWLVAAWLEGHEGRLVEVSVVAGLALLLCLLSWIDDLISLSALSRLGSHLAMTGGAVFFMPDHALVFQGVFPASIDHVLAVVIWVWFINLFNFMDGIDGISGVQLLVLGAGIAVVLSMAGYMAGHVGGHNENLALFALVLAGAACGFLIWNWPPAKIFLGDAGSAPLGFLAGWLLLQLSIQGQWEAALILPGYYLADATITLCKRLLRGDRVWLAHREHYYQQAVQSGYSHSFVALVVLICGVVLTIGAALCAAGYTLGGTVISVVAVLAVLKFFGNGPRRHL